MLESHCDTGTNAAGRTSANGVDDDHQRAVSILYRGIDSLGSFSFFDTQAGKLSTHAVDHHFRIWHRSPLEKISSDKPDLFFKYRRLEVFSQVFRVSHPWFC